MITAREQRTSRPRPGRAIALLALCAALALSAVIGCSSGGSTAAPIGSGGSTHTDAGTAAGDSGLPDSGDRDGRIEDSHGGELCHFGDADARAFAGQPQLTSVSLALHEQRVALAYHDAEALPVLELFALDGSAAGGGDFEHVELADTAATGVRVIGTQAGFAASWWHGAALHMARVTDAGEIESSVQLLERSGAQTTGMVADPSSDRVYIALQDGDTLVLVEASGELDDPSTAALLDGESSADGPALFLAGSTPSVAWSSEGSLLYSSLESTEEPLVVAEDVTGVFDVTGRGDHVAFAYALLAGDIERVRYRSFDATGADALPAQDVQRAPAVLRDASIALFGSGYALTYRSLVSRDFPDNTVRIAFMSVTGLVVYQGDVRLTSRAGGQTDIVADDQGSVALAWFDTDEVKIHVQRLQCPVALDLCNQ